MRADAGCRLLGQILFFHSRPAAPTHLWNRFHDGQKDASRADADADRHEQHLLVRLLGRYGKGTRQTTVAGDGVEPSLGSSPLEASPEPCPALVDTGSPTRSPRSRSGRCAGSGVVRSAVVGHVQLTPHRSPMHPPSEVFVFPSVPILQMTDVRLTQA
jgi:hypothetical protein